MKDVKKLTKIGKKKLEDQLKELLEVKIPENKIQLSEARSQGDLSENADFDAARAKQAEYESKVKEITEILNNCVVIDEKPRNSKKIALGSTVVVRNLKNDKVTEYTIVDTVESDPFNNWISQDCALGSALIGRVAGETVDVKSINPYKVVVEEVKFISK